MPGILRPLCWICSEEHNDKYNYKMSRLYRREKGKFVPYGWCCVKCGRMKPDEKIIVMTTKICSEINDFKYFWSNLLISDYNVYIAGIPGMYTSLEPKMYTSEDPKNKNGEIQN